VEDLAFKDIAVLARLIYAPVIPDHISIVGHLTQPLECPRYVVRRIYDVVIDKKDDVVRSYMGEKLAYVFKVRRR